MFERVQSCTLFFLCLEPSSCKQMKQGFQFVVFFLCFIILCSCKKDPQSPSGPQNFSIVDFQLDNRAFTAHFSDVSISPEIVIKFSEPIDQQSAQTAIVMSSLFGAVPLLLSFTNKDSTVTLRLANALKYWSLYNLQITTDLKSASQKHFGSATTVN